MGVRYRASDPTTEGLTLAWSPDGKWIVFPSSTNGGTPELYALEVTRALNGAGREAWIHLSQGFAEAIGPENYEPMTFLYMAWSHDGKKLAFTAAGKIYTFETACLLKPETCVDSLTVIAEGVSFWFGLQWSPDDSLVLVQGSIAGPLVKAEKGTMASDLVYLMRLVRADGSQEVIFSRETKPRKTLEDAEAMFSPALSPDGKKIVYCGGLSSAPDLYVITLEGENVQRLTDTPGLSEFEATWSPDGKQVAYIRSKDYQGDLYIQDLEGNEPVCVTCSVRPSWKTSVMSVKWSPDGEHLAYFIFGKKPLFQKWAPFYIYIIAPDGSDQVPVIEKGLPGQPFWSPDGRYLAFAFRPKPFYDSWGADILLFNLDGTGLTNLTD